MRQVVVGRFVIPRQLLTNPRQHVSKIESVETLERLQIRLRELEHRDPSARLANSGHFAQPLVGVGDPSTDSAGIVGASAEGAHFGTLTLLARWVYPQETEL